MKLCNIILLSLALPLVWADYSPDWNSLDSRPLPQWYDKAKLGIFIHWGVFSVPSFGSEWFWNYWKNNESNYVKFIKDQYPPNWTYQDFARSFDAYLFDPNWWADLIKDSGAKYVVLTSKHHEGFTLWPSNVSFSWNSQDVGPNRDLVGDLASSIRSRTDVHFGVYHSLFEWFNPLLEQDNSLKTKHFATRKTIPEMYELVNKYKPDIFWSDGEKGKPASYWNSTEFLAWLYNSSPVKDTVVVNDRWGDGTPCLHGGFWSCNDRYNPGSLIKHKWENCDSLDKEHWGYRREATLDDYLNHLEVISTLASTVSCGGNLLMNIGPRKDGRIDPLMEERLRQMGKWLRINGEAIYETQPWIYQNETNSPVWYTAKMSGSRSSIFAIVLKWPSNDKLDLTVVKSTTKTKITMLGSKLRLKWTPRPKGGVTVDFSSVGFGDLPSTIAWVLELENIAKEQQKIHPVVLQNY